MARVISKAFFKEAFSSDFESMSATLKRAVGALLDADWIDPDAECRTRLCIEEALVNAVRHGNRGNAQCKVRLEMFDCGGQCLLKVFDEGEGFRPEDVELPECEKMGGRGICLIRHYMDEVRFNAAEKCLEMTFTRKSACEGE